jgi:hypothetical protein
MPSTGSLAILTAAACLSLAACSSSSTLSHYTHATPEAAAIAASSAPDGTGPAAEALEQAESRRPAARAAAQASAQAASPARAADISARAAARPAASDPTPFSEEWWTRENNADARLKRSMDICRGC